MSTTEKIVKRDSNIELLRIILMLLIILYHILFGGAKMITLFSGTYERTSHDVIYLILFSICSAAVNCFVFISGYYGIKFKSNTFLSFYIQAIFYSLGFYLLFVFALKEVPFTNFLLTRSLIPITTNQWWFLDVYIAIYLLSPIINKGLDYLNKQQFTFIIIFLILFQCSYILGQENILSGRGLSLYSLLTVYVIARFCRKYSIEISISATIYIVYTILLGGLIYFLFLKNQQFLVSRLLGYNCPFIIVASILLFYVFKNLKIKHNKIINSTASLTFGIYLIHQYEYIHLALSKIVENYLKLIDNSLFVFLFLIVASIIVFTLCALIEKVRVIICQPLINTIFKINTIKRIAEKIDIR